MSGLGAAGTGVLLATLAIALGALAATRRPAPGPARSRRLPRLEWWPALAVGLGLLLLVDLVDVPGGLVLQLGGYALLLTVCLKNLVWTGTPIVALGLALILLPTIVDGGLPVSRDALASMDYHDPPSSLPGERHLEVPSDQLRALGDIVPLPIGWRPVSFGELILLVGLADVAYNAVTRHRGRRRSRARDEGGIDTLSSLVVAVDPIEDEPTVVVLGEATPELEAELRARAEAEAEAEAELRRRAAEPVPRPVLFDVETILDGDLDPVDEPLHDFGDDVGHDFERSPATRRIAVLLLTSRSPVPDPDPMLARRARIGQAVSAGKGVGYACFGGALVLFFVGLLTRFSGPLSAVVVTLLVIGCLVLPPAIVFGYGLRAAEREEREEAAARRSAPPGGATDGPVGETTGGADQVTDQG